MKIAQTTMFLMILVVMLFLSARGRNLVGAIQSTALRVAGPEDVRGRRNFPPALSDVYRVTASTTAVTVCAAGTTTTQL